MATKFEFKNRDGDTLAGALEEPSAPRRGVPYLPIVLPVTRTFMQPVVFQKGAGMD